MEWLLYLFLVTTEAAAEEADRLLFLANKDALATPWVQAGVMEESERDRFFTWRHNLDYDTDAMQERSRKMEPDCPPVTDKHRLPDSGYCRENVLLARQYMEWLKYYADFYGPVAGSQYQQHYADTEWRCAVWELAWDVQSSYPATVGRRVLLQQLRAKIGRLAYDRSDWPDPLPPSGYELDWHPVEQVNP